jgi:hypothetical protein
MKLTNYTLVTTHPAFGTVTFTLDAPDEKTAFTKWKSIVGTQKQWIVRRNLANTGQATPTADFGRGRCVNYDGEPDLRKANDI